MENLIQLQKTNFIQFSKFMNYTEDEIKNQTLDIEHHVLIRMSVVENNHKYVNSFYSLSISRVQ